MKLVHMTDDDAAIVDACVALEKMEWNERKRCARESKNAALLIALSRPDAEYDDPDIIENLLSNDATPPDALKNIVARKVHEDKKAMSWSADERQKKIERWTIKALQHPNADIRFASEMAQHDDWVVRYAVALELDTETLEGVQLLEKLSKDSNLAVAALASRMAGMEDVDEKLDVGATCKELNRAYDKTKQSITSGMVMVRTVGEKMFADDQTRCRFDGDEYYEVSHHINTALESLKKKLANDYATLVRHRFLPNADLDESKYLDPMDRFGKLHFDAYIVALILKTMISDRSQVSLKQLLEKAQRMLPYVHRSPDGKYDWGQANKPEHIQSGQYLELNFYVTTSEHRDEAYIDSDQMEELASFDRLSRVVLTRADPATIDVALTPLFTYSMPRREVYKKRRLPQELSDATHIVSIRAYARGKLILEYRTEADAHMVAEVLVGSAKPLLPLPDNSQH